MKAVFLLVAGPVGIGPTLAVLETAVLPLYDGPVPLTLADRGLWASGLRGAPARYTGVMSRMKVLARYAPYAGAVLLALITVVPHFALAAAGTLQPGFTIVPDVCNCAQGAGWGCLLSVFQNLTTFILYIGVLASVLAFAYAGFLLVTNATNPSNRSKARQVMIDAVVGLVIVLGGWLIVNTLISTLTTGTLTSYTAVLGGTSGNCLPTATDQQGTSAGMQTGFNPSGTPTNGAPNIRGDCTVSGLTSDGMNASIAPTMSCITKSEDTSCALGAPSGTDIGSDGKSVSFGMFQVNISANNLSQYPACEAAVNNQPLNCTAAFSGGAYTASNHSTAVKDPNLYNTCVQAASNAQCNVQAAQDLYQNHGGSKNWGTAAQRNCGS